MLQDSPRGFAMKHLMTKGIELASAACSELCLPCTVCSGKSESRVRNRGERCVSPGKGEHRRNSSEWV